MIIGSLVLEETALLELVDAKPNDVVYVSGSLVEGFGNLGSDLDVYVISEKVTIDTPYFEHGIPVQVKQFACRRVDVEYWTFAQVEQLATRLDQLSFGSETEVATYLKINEEDFVHRLKIGMPVTDRDVFQSIRDRFNYVAFRHSQVNRYLAKYSNMLEDAIGALESEDWESSFWMSRSAWEFALQAYLAFHGETHINPKWMSRKVVRLGDSTLFEKYKKFQRPQIQTEQDIADYVESCLEFANDLARQAQEWEGILS